MKIYMLPSISNLGIGRVVDAYHRHLPAYGVEFVSREQDADLVVCHAGGHAPTRQTDVLVCHGLYPTATLDKADGYFQVNADVVRNAREAMIITVPSRWVAVPFQRDMHVSPRIIPHGIEPDEWNFPCLSKGYVLWAKGHNPGVVDASVISQLASRMPTTQFKTTIGQSASNIQVLGILPYNEMKPVIQAAGAYLATTKETFGIQTLEAMACGVPVVGYKTGATPDIVVHGKTGWLVKPGDINGLVDGIQWALENRGAIGKACREAVEQLHTWDMVCEMFYDVLLEAAQLKSRPHKVSVVIPCYNYGKWVGKAIDSALHQDYSGPVEVIVVDDGSNDNTGAVVAGYGQAVTYLKKQNAGVASARNHGIQHATGDLVACLDADDWWEPNFLSKLTAPMIIDRSLGLSYGHLRSVNDHGGFATGWPPKFDFHEQAQRHNQVPSSCVFRKAAWERAGGYRAKYTPAEDAELWLRIAALGYDIRKVTDDVVYNYRLHSNSLSRSIKEPNWVEDKPYHKRVDLAPFASLGGKPSHPFRDYDDPWVSVIIPVGAGHEHLVYRALDSLESQAMTNWEVIVVNDSGTVLTHPNTGLELHQAYPYIIEGHTDRAGVARARNAGAKLAHSDLLLWLDADDWLLPGCLANVVQVYNDNPCRYVYTDWQGYDGKQFTDHLSKEFTSEGIHREAIHSVTGLVPLAWHNEIGGFDEELNGWEDWAYYLALVHAGHCGQRVPELGMVYDYSSGLRREDSLAKRNQLLPVIRKRFGKEPVMGCSSCGKKGGGGNGVVPLPAARTSSTVRGAPVMANVKNDAATQMVSVMENSGNMGSHGVVGIRTRINYGRHKQGDRFQMHIEDVMAQPQRYIRTEAVAEPVPTKPEPVVSEPVPTKPEPVPSKPVNQDILAQAMTPIPDDEVEVDITILPLVQIKQLDLGPEDAKAALDSERSAAKPRASVIKYLEELAAG